MQPSLHQVVRERPPLIFVSVVIIVIVMAFYLTALFYLVLNYEGGRPDFGCQPQYESRDYVLVSYGAEKAEECLKLVAYYEERGFTATEKSSSAQTLVALRK